MSTTPPETTGAADPVGPTGLPGWARDLLRCPACRSPLLDVDASGRPLAVTGGTTPATGLQCTREQCPGLEPGQHRRYRVDDGIPVLLVDEAAVVEAGER